MDSTYYLTDYREIENRARALRAQMVRRMFSTLFAKIRAGVSQPVGNRHAA